MHAETFIIVAFCKTTQQMFYAVNEVITQVFMK
jgi:hypothetical protein